MSRRPEFNETREKKPIDDIEESSESSDDGEEEEKQDAGIETVASSESEEDRSASINEEESASDDSTVEIEEEDPSAVNPRDPSVPRKPTKSEVVSNDDSIQILAEIKPVQPVQKRIVEARPSNIVSADRAQKEADLKKFERLKSTLNFSKLPDGGQRLLECIAKIKRELSEDSQSAPPAAVAARPTPVSIAVAAVAARPALISIADQKLIPERMMAPNPVQHRLYGGKMTKAHDNQVKTITTKVIEQMHSSLTAMPENVEMEAPDGLTVNLMLHQKHALSWMLWREGQLSPGGILADDMGLGKTLTMITLVLHKKNERRDKGHVADMWKSKALADSRLEPSNATLLVCPASLINQWKTEIERRVKVGRLRVYMFHGAKRESNANSLAKYDVVITTYGTVSSELGEKKASLIGAQDDSDDDDDEGAAGGAKKTRKPIKEKGATGESVLTRIAWERVILDEAHTIKNRNSKTSKSCCRLSASARWCLTGTPIHNELWDLFSLVRFLRIVPFCEEAVWKEYIVDRSSGACANAERLNLIVKTNLLRRTKEQKCAVTGLELVPLKPRTYDDSMMQLEGLERKVEKVKNYLKSEDTRDMELRAINSGRMKHKDLGYPNPFISKSQRVVQDGDKFQQMSSIFVMLLRLRQACVHLALTKDAVDKDALDPSTLGMEDGANMDVDAVLAHQLGKISLDEEGLGKQVTGASKEQINKLFKVEHESTKVRILLEHVERIVQSNDKCVVVSQWTSLLDIVAFHLKERRLRFTEITGKVPIGDRQQRVDDFNQTGSGPMIILLSLTAGGCGLNLVGGNHLFLVDLHWNPALERQACDRIYRMGQLKNVFVHKLVCDNTIEQRVLALQKRKLNLADTVLEGAASKNLNKLSLSDFKLLFDLDKHGRVAGVIVSQWTSLLDIVAIHLKKRRLRFTEITGKVPIGDRLVCDNTSEQRVLALQKRKLDLADTVLEGAASKKLNKLSLNDLKFLFDLGKHAAAPAIVPVPKPTYVKPM